MRTRLLPPSARRERDITRFTGTKVLALLVHKEGQVVRTHACCRRLQGERETLLALLVQKYSLYWHKRYAHTPAAAVCKARERETETFVLSLLALLVQKYKY